MKTNWKKNTLIVGGVLVALFAGLLAAGIMYDLLRQRSIIAETQFHADGRHVATEVHAVSPDPLAEWRKKTERLRVKMEGQTPHGDTGPQIIPAVIAKALTAPDEVSLYSLDPDAFVPASIEHPTPFDLRKPNIVKPTDEIYFRTKVLGKVHLVGTQAIEAAHEFLQAMAQAHPNGMEMKCFNPRHGLQVINSGHTFDFKLCYECKQMAVYEDGKEIPNLDLIAVGSPTVLNGILIDAHIPLPRQPKD